MGVTLTNEELDEFLENGHTLIVATTRASGEPFMTPLWYLWKDGAFWVGTAEASAKVRHIRRDPRVCCMVEAGEAWIDLKAVIANCQAEIVDDPQIAETINAAIARKYAPFRTESAAMPQASREHYARKRVVIRMTPREGEIRSWWNRKLRLKAGG